MGARRVEDRDSNPTSLLRSCSRCFVLILRPSSRMQKAITLASAPARATETYGTAVFATRLVALRLVQDKTQSLKRLACCRPDLHERGSNLRGPADIYTPAWQASQPAALDIAVASSQIADSLREAHSDLEQQPITTSTASDLTWNSETQCGRSGNAFPLRRP